MVIAEAVNEGDDWWGVEMWSFYGDDGIIQCVWVYGVGGWGYITNTGYRESIGCSVSGLKGLYS